MKKCLFIAFTVICGMIEAQENKTYIVFTSISKNNTEGIYRRTVSENDTKLYNKDKENYPRTSFLMLREYNNNGDDFYNHYMYHKNLKSDPNPLRIYKKPLSWLSTIDYVDWDAVGAGKTKKEVDLFFTELHFQERIYMIDRRDFTQDSLTVIEARAYKPLQY
ncbi:MAG: hypothetical protein PHD21_01110 [Flavobacteriales bacterium]|nr:hypothetical protein [Flavobacteriales bacterium]